MTGEGLADAAATAGLVLSVERCSLHDGPGLRTTVFLKGCPLNCLWCHNPESRSFTPELYYFDEKCVRCGLCKAVCVNHQVNAGAHSDSNERSNPSGHSINRKACTACGKCQKICPNSAFEIKGEVMTAGAVIQTALKDERYYKQSGGGLTLSGGEPLAQLGFTRALLRLAKESGLHTCLETSGCIDTDGLLSIIPFVDLFLYDFKESDENLHKKYTGVSNRLIYNNLQAVDQAGAKIILRCPIVPGCNDRDSHFSAISETANILKNITEVNLMPYHPLGASKARRIGQKYLMAEIGFPADEQINGWLQKAGKNTKIPVKRG